MRLVKKDLADTPDVFKKQSTLDDWEIIAITANKDKIKDDIYKGTYTDKEGKSQSYVRDRLNKFYHTKCAYCETLCKAEIEHYRPKKGITGNSAHPGYYWLCYEWSNLVPSCRYCNTEGGKGNQFPIEATGVRVDSPVIAAGQLDKTKCNANDLELQKEKPLLLHPEIDTPETHLKFCWKDDKQGIYITEADSSERGKQTIKICNLNREDLRIERLKIVLEPIKNNINLLFSLVNSNDIASHNLPKALKIFFRQLEDSCKDETLLHTLLRKFIVSSNTAFEQIVGAYFTDINQQTIIIAAFKAYKNGTL